MRSPVTLSPDSTTYAQNGLSSEEVLIRRQKFGKNELRSGRSGRIFSFIKGTVTEPMFLLLVLSSVTYFVLGSATEGAMMIVAILIVSAISFFQEIRSSNAIAALNDLSEPMISVLRDG